MPQDQQHGDLVIEGLSKNFGGKGIVSDVSLELRHGEIIALLGPSGCGKTTTLRMVAGLAQPDRGEIRHRDRVLVSTAKGIHLPPEKRHVGMVFQSYALWPHMTVRENVSYPLRLRKRPRDEIKSRVDAVLGLIGLRDLGDRLVPQLSGGQQQRVALARALVYEPALMLFDEPFSNLDAQLRTQMRLELKTLRRSVAMTGFFVTHDQTEALSIADRIAIMNGGRIEQIGTPVEVYQKPATRFVRDFLGQAISLRGRIQNAGRPFELGFNVPGVLKAEIDAPGFSSGEDVEVSIRPEHVTVVPATGTTAEANTLPATLLDLLFIGEKYEARIDIGGQSNALMLPAGTDWIEGQQVLVRFDPKRLQLWRIGASSHVH